MLKEGPAEDASNQQAIAKLLRFATTHTDSSAQTVSLEEYVSRMKEGAGEDLLHHRRQLCGGEEQPAPRAAA